MAKKTQVTETETIIEEGKKRKGLKAFFDRFSNKATIWTGSPYAFITAFIAVIAWAATGPIFKYSDTWQLVINTSTTIITFLMVFLIQQSQNKDTVALQLKLDELISANDLASNRLVDVEELNEEDLKKLKKFYSTLRGNIKHEKEIHESHSIDQVKNEEGNIKVTTKEEIKVKRDNTKTKAKEHKKK
jgi:low affinity Fe/Cu permease